MLVHEQSRVNTGCPTGGQLGCWGLAVWLCLVTLHPAATMLAAAGVPELRYRFQPGQKYVYEVKITADFGEMKETRGGLSIYEVKSATADGITLTHSGSLAARRTTRDGQPVVTFPSIRNPFFWTRNVTARQSELTIDAHGEIVQSQILTSLPYMLGDFQVLVIEPLPETSKPTWEKKREVTITEKEPSRFPPIPVGPFGPRRRDEVHRSAGETISYTIVASDGQTARIKRTYTLRTDDLVQGKPRLEMTGAGERSFDLQEGVATSELMKYTIRAHEGGLSLTIPVTVNYRLLGPEESAERLKQLEEKKAASPRPTAVETTSVPTTDSELAGGSGGVAFRYLDPAARPVLGVRYQLGRWAGEQVVGRLEPLYTRDPVPAPWQVVLARDGYALGAIQVDGTRFVNAVRLAFMKLEGEKLNTQDRYLTPWIGTPGGTAKSVFSTGARVLGLHGKRAAVLDAVGLVFEAE